MGRLKKDHGGWRSSGLYLKYKSPTVDEKPARSKKRKNTAKWCKGKSGVEHVLIRKFYRTYNDGRYFDYDYYNGKLFKHIECACVTCGKEFYRPNAKDIRLVIPVRLESVKMPIQVKFNGKAIPINYHEYTGDSWCVYCKQWHWD